MPGTGLLLAPYNDSMCLGQGFNCFLQVPCIDNAVTCDESKVITEHPDPRPTGVSQVVSYSSRLVEKISDIAQIMNISAGSSIKNGSINVSGNSLSIDEAKFLSSDIECAGVSKGDESNPIEDLRVDNEKFLDIYGDCYISGFVEGGELHGIVSIKALDASNKKDIEIAIKRQMNGMGPMLNEGSGGSQLSSALSETETTISVSWSGGGHIKPESKEWSLDTLFRTAAGFPARVAACPQRTWAILTKYQSNRSFVGWADKNKISISQYQDIQAYTSHLLDRYMEYKAIIARLEAVLRNPQDYVVRSVHEAISTNVASLVFQRERINAQMELIVKEIDILCIHPEKIGRAEGKPQIPSPEVWMSRLPVLKTARTDSGGQVSIGRVAQISAEPPKISTSVVEGSIPTAEPETILKLFGDLIKKSTSEVAASIGIHPLCTPAVEAMMSPSERKFVTSADNRFRFRSYRFDMPCGSATGNPFNDADELSVVPMTWPTRIEIILNNYRARKYPIVGSYKVHYDQLTLKHGMNKEPAGQSLSMDLSQGEFIAKVKLAAGKNDNVSAVMGVIYVEVETSQGRVTSVGDAHGHRIIEVTPPTGYLGFKGFYGNYGVIIDRMGVIWGQSYP
ncbi:hypothetical protein BGX38DRAFT_1334221 [Terfezia claveryi]|nr:hypothetical protein BGX38DRAFT_1334221 [Terfezia claveryi]